MCIKKLEWFLIFPVGELFMRSCISARSVKDGGIVVATQPYFSE